MNYRSVVAFGITRLVDDPVERLLAAERFTEHVLPGRWADARQPNTSEMKKTMFIAVEMEESSFKFRAQGVGDDAADMGLPVWAGVIPVQQQFMPPEPDGEHPPLAPVPDYISRYSRGK